MRGSADGKRGDNAAHNPLLDENSPAPVVARSLAVHQAMFMVGLELTAFHQ
jgi:hypothetical protein